MIGDPADFARVARVSAGTKINAGTCRTVDLAFTCDFLLAVESGAAQKRCDAVGLVRRDLIRSQTLLGTNGKI